MMVKDGLVVNDVKRGRGSTAPHQKIKILGDAQERMRVITDRNKDIESEIFGTWILVVIQPQAVSSPVEAPCTE